MRTVNHDFGQTVAGEQFADTEIVQKIAGGSIGLDKRFG